MHDTSNEAFEWQEVPSLEHKLNEILTLFQAEGRLVLLSIDLLSLIPLQTEYDKGIYDTALQSVKKCLGSLSGNEIRKDDIVCSNISDGSKYYVFLSRARVKRYSDVHDIEKIAFRVQDSLYNKLFELFYPFSRRGPEVKIGYASRFFSRQIDARSLLQRCMDDASAIAPFLDIKAMMIREELFAILLKEENVDVRYQPLVHLSSQKIIGYEAFVSGPRDTMLQNAYGFYNYARESAREHEIDWISRKHAVLKADKLGSGKKLFIKICRQTVFDEAKTSEQFYTFLREKNLELNNLVFEIKDRTLVQDERFLSLLFHQFYGITLAVEINDIWNNDYVKETELPSIKYLKIGIDVVRDVHKDENRQNQIRLLVKFAHESGKEVLALGIHTTEEVKQLVELGVDIGQGYYFAKPEAVFQELSLSRDYLEDKELARNLLASIYFKRGRDYFQQNDFDKAILEFTKVLEIDPNNIESYYYRGFSYCEESLPIAVEQDLAKMKEIDPEYPYQFLVEGKRCELRNYKSEAMRAYTEFLSRAGYAAARERDYAEMRLKELGEK
ncbi:MAG: EAL domain-containing protein [Spirochaetales bacterium]|nr:EAL domain-containing protein [Spirochaetales bacterium]